MYVREVEVKNQVGLHARPATVFVMVACGYEETSIWVQKEYDDYRVNAKSLIGIVSKGIIGGIKIKIIADGPEEKEAVTRLAKLIESNFAEEYR